MSVLIKGMEMPTSCGDCKAFVCYKQWAGDMGDCFCGITKNDAKAKEKNADCPLVPVPPHGRLIDADALENEHMKRAYENFGSYQFHVTATAWINEAPTIIPASEEGK